MPYWVPYEGDVLNANQLMNFTWWHDIIKSNLLGQIWSYQPGKPHREVSNHFERRAYLYIYLDKFYIIWNVFLYLFEKIYAQMLEMKMLLIFTLRLQPLFIDFIWWYRVSTNLSNVNDRSKIALDQIEVIGKNYILEPLIVSVINRASIYIMSSAHSPGLMRIGFDCSAISS